MEANSGGSILIRLDASFKSSSVDYSSITRKLDAL